MFFKHAFYAVLAVAAAACSSGGDAADPADPVPSPKPPTAAVKVISFNIRVDSRDAYGWDKRREAAARMVNEALPTVMGLQEAQPHQITYLMKSCPGYAWYGLGRDTGKAPAETEGYAAEECMAIFYRTSDVELLDKGTFWLSETPGKVSYGWDANYRRTATWGRFRLKTMQKEFLYLNTHLDNQGSVARGESIKLIVAKLAELNPEGLPVFLTADFNSTTSNSIFNPLRSVLMDARTHAPAADTGGTYNGWGTKSTVIDHIFYRKATPTGFNVLRKNYGVTYISDHYPVEATFGIQ